MARKSSRRKSAVVTAATRTSLQDIIRFFLTAPVAEAVTAQEVIAEIVAYRQAEIASYASGVPASPTNGHDADPLVAEAPVEATSEPARRRPGRPRKAALAPALVGQAPLPSQDATDDDEIVSEA